MTAGSINDGSVDMYLSRGASRVGEELCESGELANEKTLVETRLTFRQLAPPTSLGLEAKSIRRFPPFWDKQESTASSAKPSNRLSQFFIGGNLAKKGQLEVSPDSLVSSCPL